MGGFGLSEVLKGKTGQEGWGEIIGYSPDTQERNKRNDGSSKTCWNIGKLYIDQYWCKTERCTEFAPASLSWTDICKQMSSSVCLQRHPEPLNYSGKSEPFYSNSSRSAQGEWTSIRDSEAGIFWSFTNLHLPLMKKRTAGTQNRS